LACTSRLRLHFKSQAPNLSAGGTPQEVPDLATMNEYSVSYDENYILSSIDRYRRQRHVYPWFIAVKLLCGLGLALLLGIIIWGVMSASGQMNPLLIIAAVIGGFLLLLLQGPRIDYFFLKRGLKKSPLYGENTRIEVDDSGVSVSTSKTKAILQWSAFTKARRLDAGFLIFTDPNAFQWWPDTALVSGTVDEVDRLLQAKVVAYERSQA